MISTYGTNRLACVLLIIRLNFVSPRCRNFIRLMLSFQANLPYIPLMKTSKVLSALPYGINSRIITVESDANQGLPSLNIIGMASRSIEESKDRIKSAIKNTGFAFPRQKIIVNLAPAELNKSGSTLDLPIALVILALSGQLLERDLKDRLFVGELSLNGDIKPVRGIISIIECAKRRHIKEVFIPKDNIRQAELVASNIKIYPIDNLREL